MEQRKVSDILSGNSRTNSLQTKMAEFRTKVFLNKDQGVEVVPPLKFPVLTNLKYKGGARWRGWLGHYATSRQVAGSIPDEVFVFFFQLT
jgi:hypothetical protein